jgi:pimeloyl-ACP methyl ester carboxylesterase
MTESNAHPIFFGRDDRTLFGWLHRPTDEKRRRVGIVICNPLGYEAVCAHRSLRRLAEKCAAAGFPTIRFDYDGTGDSAGEECDPGRVEGWIASINAAANELIASEGIDRLLFIGLRLGATLATLAAASRADICGLIAIAPIVNVKHYMREVRALSLMQSSEQLPEWAQIDPDVLDVAGFPLTKDTRAELSEIDLATIAQGPTGNVLILNRDDLPGDELWPARLREAGVAVEQEKFAGYVEMMLDAHQALVPGPMLERCVQWAANIGELNFDPVRHQQLTSTIKTAALPDQGVIEQAFSVPDMPELFSILSQPAMASGKKRPRVVLFLNAGAVTHIGPNRLYVRLARYLARNGVTAVRVDLAGLGDSSTHDGEPENVVYSRLAIQDIAALHSHIQKRFPRARLSVVGLCSGGYHGFKAAVSGLRFDQVIAINPLTFFWKEDMSLAIPEYQVFAEASRYSKTAFKISSWWKLLSGKTSLRATAGVISKRAMIGAKNIFRDVVRAFNIELEEDLGTELKKLARRSTKVTFVFARTDPGLPLLLGQAGSVVDRLRRKRALKIEMIEGADHTFTQHWTRRRLMDVLSRSLGIPPSRS